MRVLLCGGLSAVRVAFALACGLLVIQVLVIAATGSSANEGHLEVFSGTARVVDGDTIDVAGQRLRLEGIDAPEAGQRCPGRYVGGILGPWRCGRAATRALVKLIGSRPVTCESQETDKYDRRIATCFVGGMDINAEMVRRGHAWAFVKYSRTYVKHEADARAAKVGIWASRETAQPAWDYRKRRWAGAEQVAPEGCAIKGNISRKGQRIYHTPWSPWYKKVRVDTRHGERWFCDEAQALAAGWRSARVR
ncbi:MAG: thermonuclease family protein [Alphaproteobacteria bacterium]|nr:thermonuclease family protein [Alphaproteobacteria bacterium]